MRQLLAPFDVDDAAENAYTFANDIDCSPEDGYEGAADDTSNSAGSSVPVPAWALPRQKSPPGTQQTGPTIGDIDKQCRSLSSESTAPPPPPVTAPTDIGFLPFLSRCVSNPSTQEESLCYPDGRCV